MHTALIRFALVACGLLVAFPVGACNVPVFRYALENWSPDPYFMSLLHQGPLTDSEQKLAEVLAKEAATNPPRINLAFDRVDLALWPKADRDALLKRMGNPTLPQLKVKHPLASQVAAPVYKGSFNAFDLENVLDSPARKELAKRLMAGDSAVWILLEANDPGPVTALVGTAFSPWAVAPLSLPDLARATQDDRAANELEVGLQELDWPFLAASTFGELALANDLGPLAAVGNLIYSRSSPPTKGMNLPKTGDPEDELKAKDLELKVAFSIIRLQRDDPAEQEFVKMLLNLERHFNGDPKAPESTVRKPMAFAVFGRGRALAAGTMAGAGINADEVAKVCRFLFAPCSCKVKEEIYGVDLLLNVDWEAGIAGRSHQGFDLSQLTGLVTADFDAWGGGQLIPPPESNWLLYRNLGLALAAGLVILAAVALLRRGNVPSSH